MAYTVLAYSYWASFNKSTPFYRVDVYKNGFYLVMIRLWNTLPEDIIYSNSLRQFRTSANFYLTN